MRTLRALAAALAGALILPAIVADAPARAALPPVRHVFVIVLENKDYKTSFGARSQARYLTRTLAARGQVLTRYHGTSHASLGNYISMISGQAPTPQTQADCHRFDDLFPGTPTPDGQVLGSGCVYPAAVKTLADQLTGKGLVWRGYFQDMANDPSQPTCRHPAIGATDTTQKARRGDQYAVRHDPFVYFHSIIDDRARCHAGVVDLLELPTDLRSARTTPAFSLVVPNLCEDGHDAPCVDGRPGGLVSADAFLRAWVPRITRSPAYRDGGMLVVTWDEGSISRATSVACCDEPSGPNTPLPGIFGPGGGRTGAVVLSRWTDPGTTNGQPYNHYALLRSIEDLFGLNHLGYAAQPGLRPFGADVFDAPSCTTTARLTRGARGRTLTVRSARAARLRVTVAGGARTYARALASCRTVRLALPAAGRVTVRVGARTLAVG